MQFSPPKAVPGEKSSLQLSAQPGSLCGLSAVDRSVLILEPGKRLDAQKVTIATLKISTLTLSISLSLDFSGYRHTDAYTIL